MRAPAAVLLLALPLAACMAGGGEGAEAAKAASAAAVTDPGTLQGTHWRLVAGLPGVDPAAFDVTLAFEADGRIGGSGGCNHYGAAIEPAGEGVRIGPVVATKRGCPGQRNQVEAAYFGALDQVRSLQRQGETLLLRGEQLELRFTATGAQPSP